MVEIYGGYGDETSDCALFMHFAFVYFKAIDVLGFEITDRALSWRWCLDNGGFFYC